MRVRVFLRGWYSAKGQILKQAVCLSALLWVAIIMAVFVCDIDLRTHVDAERKLFIRYYL